MQFYAQLSMKKFYNLSNFSCRIAFVAIDSYADDNLESPAQFENQIKPRIYLRHIMRNTMYEKPPFFSQNWRKEN